MKKNFLYLAAVCFVLGLTGCNYTGIPVEYAKACDKANDRKYIEIAGFFKNTGSAMCSKSGNEPMRCPIEFIDTPNQPQPIRTSIDLGSGANYIENAEGKGLTIRDDKGEIVENSQKVKITGSLMVFTSPPDPKANYAPCAITVKKIEKVQ